MTVKTYEYNRNGTDGLAGKLDADHSNDTKPYVVETYHNGRSWYRIWSDGWIEQGGWLDTNTNTNATASFLKKFTVIPQCWLTAYFLTGNYAVSVKERTISSLTIHSGYSGQTIVNYYVCGY